MSAETLRRAAAQIRNDHGGIVSRTTLDGRRWLPVADWLDVEAENDDPCQASTPADCYVHDCSTHRALAVARAYLGEAPNVRT